MRLIFINPVYSDASRFPPINLLSLAAYARQQGHRVELIDAGIQRHPPRRVARTLAGMGIDPAADLICLTMMTPQYGYVRELVREIRAHGITAPACLGGVHASVLPGETLAAMPGLDYIVFGEGELTLMDLVRHLETPAAARGVPAIPGLCHREGGVRCNPPRPLIEDINILPMPAWDLVDVARYYTPMAAQRYRMATRSISISASRGCPFNCLFCASGSVFGKSRRVFSPDWVMRQIDHLYGRGVNDFFFVDEVLATSREAMLDLCRLITQRGMAITWACNSRVNSPILDPETLGTMVAAGCRRLDFGVEAGNDAVLRRITKGITIGQVEHAHRTAQSVPGLKTTTLMMTGHPYETMDDVNDSIALIARLGTDYPEFGSATPFPGTAMYQLAKENGWLATDVWDDYLISGLKGVTGNGVFSSSEMLLVTEYANHHGRIYARINGQVKDRGRLTIWSLARLFYADLPNRSSWTRLRFRRTYEIAAGYLADGAGTDRYARLIHQGSLRDLRFPYGIGNGREIHDVVRLLRHRDWSALTARTLVNLAKVGLGYAIKLAGMAVGMPLFLYYGARLRAIYQSASRMTE